MRVLFGAAMALALGACSQQPTAPLTGDALVQRGEYVVSIAGCHDCHTPMTPQGPDMAQALQGSTLFFAPIAEMPWAPVAPQLAGLPAGYSEEQLAAFLQTGVRPDGSHPLPPMPPLRMNEADARAVAAYVRSLPAPQ
jgi:mono/diheme cytochrome c family protein